MRKKLVSLAVLAGLTAGMGSAHAVHVNPDGLGEVLLFPFYSATSGASGNSDTYINIVNTTDDVKAVKVRFLEAWNSVEVLDFNLYLSPQDHWSAVITIDGNGLPVLRTADTSCTVPEGLASKEVGQAGDTVNFVDFGFDLVGSNPTNNILPRGLEGHVEIIEMGVVTDVALAAAATHGNDSLPADCGAIADAWRAGGLWAGNPQDGMDVNSGGLYGYGVLINVNEGTNATYDALALDDFADLVLHAQPGTINPNLNQGAPVADVIDGTTIYSVGFDGDRAGLDAVSAVLMHNSIMNDYVLEPTINAGTDWVITFPTKRAYVGAGGPFAPFTSTFAGGADANSGACETIAINYWNREEQLIEPTPEDITYSPPPPIPEADVFSLCKETNILTFNQSNVLNGSNAITKDLTVNFDNGWAKIDFDTVAGRDLTGEDIDENLVTFHGLPVIGFAVQKYVNGNVGGVLSNYAGLVNHKATRFID